MPVLALGVSYRRAPVELLERLTIPDDELSKAYRRLAELESVGESVVLSTCNRVEVYADVDAFHSGFQDLKRFLSEATDVSVEELAEPLYSHYEDQAAEHLFSVAAGLDSMVLGEPQILAQVRSAFRGAEREGATGARLGDLFGRAVRAGRRVRAETAIGASPSAFVDAGLDLAEERLGPIASRAALVLGAGEMGSLAAAALRERGVRELIVIGRREERARRLAERFDARTRELEELETVLGAVEVVITSTASVAPVIGAPALSRAAAGRELFLLDLAVPRDVDPAATEVPGVHLLDIDDLAQRLEERRGDAAGAVSAARGIIEAEVERFSADRRSRRLAPLIRALHDMGEEVRAEELRRFAPRLAELSDRERRAIEALTGRIVARLLHEPTVRLKDLAGRGQAEAQARALAELFGLDLSRDPRGSGPRELER